MKKETPAETVFGKKIKEATSRAGRSVHSLAMDAKISPPNLYSICSGKRGASEKDIESLSSVDWLGVSSDEMRAWADADRLGEEGIKRLIDHQIIDINAHKQELQNRIKELRAELKAAGDNEAELGRIYNELTKVTEERKALQAKYGREEDNLSGPEIQEVANRKERIEELHRFMSDQIELPYFGQVGCGKFLILNEHAEEMRLVPREIAEGGDAVVEACGDSMNQAGIQPGMSLVVKRQNFAEHGQVVLATIPYVGTTCKRYVVRDDKAFLVSESTTTYSEIPVEDGVNIMGIVKSIWYCKVLL